MGKLEIIIGSMFSGKTSEMIRRVERYKVSKKACVTIKYSRDTRYSDDCVTSHDKTTLSAVPVSLLADVAPEVLDSSAVIGIDEAQFFPDLISFCCKQLQANKIIIIAALDGTFQRKPFGSVCDLIPQAESVVKLSALCTVCCSDAAFSHRTSAETSVEVIGGAETYTPLCRSCLFKRPTKGSIHVIVGPVFSGKTNELIRHVRRFRNAKKTVILTSNVPEAFVVSHSKEHVLATCCTDLRDLEAIAGDADVVAIDKGHAYDHLASVCETLANAGKHVLVASLDGDMAQQPYEEVSNLIPLAETVTKLSAICSACGSEAPFSSQTFDGLFVPLCRSCLTKK